MKNIYLIGIESSNSIFYPVPEAGAYLTEDSAQKECDRRNEAEKTIPKEYQEQWALKKVEIKA